MTKRPTPTSFGLRCSSKTRDLETGCGKALIAIGAVVIIVYAVALVLFLTRAFGLWPDWAIEFELLIKAWIQAWVR